MELADKYGTMEVRANADTPKDALQSIQLRSSGHRSVPYRAHVL